MAVVVFYIASQPAMILTMFLVMYQCAESQDTDLVNVIITCNKHERP